MFSSAFFLLAGRSRAAIGVFGAVVALGAGTGVMAPAAQAAPAGGWDGGGHATAVVLRAGLDVSLLDKTVGAPLNVSLNDVQAPADAHETALTARLGGVDDGRTFDVLRADVATARATADTHHAEGYVNLADARVTVPGLPLLPLIELHAVTVRATCDAGSRPTAYANPLGDVTVLGKRVTLSAGGTTQVAVPGIGEVRLALGRTVTTSGTAAATALDLKVAVNPLKLNVAAVTGEITLARATCDAPKSAAATTPTARPAPTAQGSSAGQGAKTRSAGAPRDLAETGAGSTTPYLAAGAVAFVAAGGAVTCLARRRRKPSEG